MPILFGYLIHEIKRTGLEIFDPVLLYIRTKSEILTGNKEILWDIWEIPQKGRKQAISGALPSKWINSPVACYNAVIRDFC